MLEPEVVDNSKATTSSRHKADKRESIETLIAHARPAEVQTRQNSSADHGKLI